MKKTSYDNQNDWDWSRLREPTPGELHKIAEKAEIEETQFIEALKEESIAETFRRQMPLDELLAASAYQHIATTARMFSERHTRRMNSKEFDELRRKTINDSIPQDLDLTEYWDLLKSVSSKLGKMLNQSKERNRARKERRKLNAPTYAQKKERRAAQEALARKKLEEGPLHGEFYLPGIKAKSVWKKKERRPRGPYKKMRKPITLDERLGSLVTQTEEEEWKKKHGNRVGTGYRPEYNVMKVPF
jgi:hypothetical protein